MIDDVGWTGPQRIGFVYRTYAWSRLYEFDISSSKLSVLIDNFPDNRFDSNERQIVFNQGSKVCVFDLSSHLSSYIDRPSKYASILFDGDNFLTLQRRSDKVNSPIDFLKFGRNGGATTVVASFEDLENAWVVSPNRKLLASANSADRVPKCTIYRLDASGSDVASTIGTPIGWKDDNSLVVRTPFDAKDNATMQLFQLSDGTLKNFISRLAEKCVRSSDGNTLLFHDVYHIFTSSANGSDIVSHIDIKDLPAGDREKL